MKRFKSIIRALLPASLRSDLLRIANSLGLDTPAPAPFAWPFRQLMQDEIGLKPFYKEQYRWGTYCAALTARNLGYERISLIEFGVAGGTGLVALEQAAKDAELRSGVQIEVYGFDTGVGLPKPQDYRDLPNLWREGDYRMDVPKLRSRLNRAELILGHVSQTVPAFIAQRPAPVGFVSFDLDMYSSTMDAFQIFRADAELLLPRVVCYFDDIIGYTYSEYTGERAAIADFNQADPMRKISPLFGLSAFLGSIYWTELMYMMHMFNHPRYGDFDGMNLRPELPLREVF